jgi:c-di-GMP-binding flagellar brake protein YcgR
MQQRRRHPRYDVSEVPQVKAATKQGPIGERLMTISRGGCAFWAPVEDFQMSVGQMVHIRLSVGDSSPMVEVRGELLYIQPYPMESQIGRFYGVRFEESQSGPAWVEAMSRLDELFSQGKIKSA